MLSCLNGGIFIISGMLILGFTGCSSLVSVEKDIQFSIPPSYIQVEEKVIGLAFEGLGIPEGYGKEVFCNVRGDGKASGFLRVIAPEILINNGYRVVEEKSTFSELRVSIDTLQVTLTTDSSSQAGKSIRRFAEVQIGAVFLDAEGNRHVYRGSGTYNDSFASHMLDSLDSDDPYVIDLVSPERIITKVKPVFVGVAMTVVLWMLYSYRG
ncbi:hypothetical protein ACFL1R_07465 [Candidatus Latescibacterota bacterium]